MRLLSSRSDKVAERLQDAGAKGFHKQMVDGAPLIEAGIALLAFRAPSLRETVVSLSGPVPGMRWASG
jgi:hypothetical protein